MTRIVLPSVLVVAALALPPSAQAASLTRTFVSSAGNDSNACTVTAPCRTFAGAYANTAANGIIAALDPGGYGSLTITGPVTVDGNGWAAITVPTTGNGITINAGSTDKVVLRGLTIDGAQTGNRGIEFDNGGSLTMDGCVVRNTASHSLSFLSGGANETLTVSNSSFIDSAADGIHISLSAGSATASIDRSDVSNNRNGLIVNANNGASVHAALRDSVAANNTNLGLVAEGDGTGIANLTVTDTQVLGNPVGVVTFVATNTIWLAHSTIVGNTTGYEIMAGTINSFGDNYFANNGSNTGTLGSATKQ